LDGANSNFYRDSGTTNALAGFATNSATGTFTVQNGRSFSSPADFSNAGALSIGTGSTFTATGAYTQTAGSTTLSGGTLAATGGVSLQGGSLAGTGTVNSDVSNAAIVSPGTATGAGLLTVNGNYTQTSAGTLNVKLGGLSAGTQFDRL